MDVPVLIAFHVAAVPSDLFGTARMHLVSPCSFSFTDLDLDLDPDLDLVRPASKLSVLRPVVIAQRDRLAVVT